MGFFYVNPFSLMVFHGAETLENIMNKRAIDKYFKNFNLKKIILFYLKT